MLKEIQVTQDVADEHIRKQLDLATQTIDVLNAELKQRNEAFLGTVNAYAALANAGRSYLADPSGQTRPHFEFLLAKAPE